MRYTDIHLLLLKRLQTCFLVDRLKEAEAALLLLVAAALAVAARLALLAAALAALLTRLAAATGHTAGHLY